METRKIDILHITDMHIKDDECLELLNPLVKAINARERIPSIILVSGDIAKSGDINQYEKANQFFTRLKQLLASSEKNLSMYFVPGNHDLKFLEQVSSDQRFNEIEELKPSYHSHHEPELIKKEKEKLSNFNYFITTMGLKNNNEIVNICDEVLGEYKVKIIGINSAIFSSWHEEDNNNDKSFHFIQKKDLEKVSNKDCNLSILLIHHNPEWYSETCKFDLWNTIKKSIDIMIYGHEHILNNECTNNAQNDGFYSLISGAFLDEYHNSEFSIISFDIIESSVKKDSYRYNKDLHEYHQFDTITDTIRVKSKNGFAFQLNTAFENEFYIDKPTASFTRSISDIFIFPELVLQGTDISKLKVSNFVDFEKQIHNDNVICISGGRTSGKTTFTKMLFKYYEKKKVVIYLQSIELSGRTDLREAIDNSLKKQYIDKDVVKMHYLNVSRDQKICIIDNFDLIGDQKLILKLLLGEFSKVIITSSRDYDIDQAIDRSIKQDRDFISLCKFQIKPFINKKRDELIRKVFNLVVDRSMSNKDELYQSTIKYVKRQIKIFNHNPYFLVLYAKDFITSGGSGDEKHGVFSKVFEADLIYKIAKNCDSTMSLAEFNFLCTKLAFKVYNKSVYPIPSKIILDMIEEHNTEFDENFDFFRFIDIGIKSNIINKFGNSNNYVFSTDNYFAYYVACFLLSIITKPEFKSEFESLLDNILIRINSNILLFFSFLIGYNTTILDFVISKIKQISTNEEELKLTNRNVQIESSRIYDKIDLPSQKDIDKIDVIEDEIEERLVSENEIIKVDNIFSLEVDSNFKALTKGIKLIRYIEIISKAFPDFHHKMNKVERKEQVESMFRVPNIISYIAYNDVREKLNNLKEEIYTELRNENPKSKMKVLYDNLESEINRFLAFFTITTFDIISQNAIDKKTIEVFEKYRPSGDLIYDLEMLTFQAEVMKYPEFVQKALEIHSKLKDDIEKEMLKEIIVKFIILNSDKRDYHLELKIRAEIFGYKGDVPKLTDRIKNG